GLIETQTCTVKGKGFIVLDFGKEYSGGARIITVSTSAPTVKVRLRFGESVAETYAEIGQKGACNDHSLRDFEIALTSFADMIFAQTGFRFLRIDFLEEQTVVLKSVYCAHTHRLFPAHKPFNSPDERINEIFFTAKRTVEMCCQSYLWDGIKRDRLVWIGDIHPEMLALTALYGKTEIIEDALRLTAKQYPLGTWQNTMPMYSAWWVIIMADYCYLTGDYSVAKELTDYALGVVKQCNDCVKADGTLDFPSYFVDWQTHDKTDEMAGCRAILTIMAKKAKQLFGKPGLADEVASELLAKLNLKPITVEKAKQVIALKYLAQGEISSQEKEIIVSGGASGFSTFMSYYLLKTLAENHSVEYAVAVMKEYYGAMLDKGATTFFEDFNIEWVKNSSRIDELPRQNQLDLHGDFGDFCYKGYRHSLCHGWSAGVIKFLYEYCNQED
ncbi:MAG: alpha-L-rhamnosidase, partial [Clostridia bacterium]|nr:alpha-L-rhamnosidase [Clostridia bacterium]